MSDYRTTADNQTLVLFPFALPADFVGRLGYPGTDALIGIYGRGDAGSPIIYDRCHVWPTGPDPLP
ncbi:MAG TPA: hypothetical protein VFZ25_01580 [Chloroflexota bacterium]|nr:hypothetical protein [Chloroflexota bacterium]